MHLISGSLIIRERSRCWWRITALSATRGMMMWLLCVLAGSTHLEPLLQYPAMFGVSTIMLLGGLPNSFETVASSGWFTCQIKRDHLAQ